MTFIKVGLMNQTPTSKGGFYKSNAYIRNVSINLIFKPVGLMNQAPTQETLNQEKGEIATLRSQ